MGRQNNKNVRTRPTANKNTIVSSSSSREKRKRYRETKQKGNRWLVIYYCECALRNTNHLF